MSAICRTSRPVGIADSYTYLHQRTVSCDRLANKPGCRATRNYSHLRDHQVLQVGQACIRPGKEQPTPASVQACGKTRALVEHWTGATTCLSGAGGTCACLHCTAQHPPQGTAVPSRICCKVNSCEGGSSVWERDVPVVDALVAHVTAQDATVGCETGGGDAQVIVHLEHLLRVRRQLRWSPLQAGQNYVAVALQSAQHQPHQHVTSTSCTGNELVGHCATAAYGCDAATKSRSRFSACHLCERHVDTTTPAVPLHFRPSDCPAQGWLVRRFSANIGGRIVN